MDAEIQFFMTAKDEQDFLAVADKHVDKIEGNKGSLILIIGDCQLVFNPSERSDNTIYAGRLLIRSSNESASDLERAKSIFRKLRNWIKKKYFSRLAFINKKGKLTPSRIHWLGPDAKKWKQQDPEEYVLKLSHTSNTVFDIGF